MSSPTVGGGAVEGLDRSIGLDVHRDFCEVAIADGGRARAAGRVATTPEALELFATSLGATDVSCWRRPGTRWRSRVKTDRIDARVLADLLAAGLIPEVWIGDDRCRMLRRLVSRRRGLVKRRTQVKNEISAVLHRNLAGPNPASDPFSGKGRAWMLEQQLPLDERLT